VILEGEALSINMKTGAFYPFQVTIQRKRKHGIGKMAEEYPLKLFVFDIMFLDGKDLTVIKYQDRREELNKVIEKNDIIEVSEGIVTDNSKEIDDYFEKCVSRGLEGIIAKDLNAQYVAGKRKFAWIKLKRSYKGELADTVDVTIVGYYKGRGARTKFGLGGLLSAVYDPDTDTFKTIARIGTGFSDEQLKSFKERLDKIKEPHKHARVDSLVEADVWVEPKFVIPLTADEITKSPMHTCGMEEGVGYALRFPRLVGDIREDKNPEDSTSVDEIREMYKLQKHVKIEN
jgi:DNA ligase-1